MLTSPASASHQYYHDLFLDALDAVSNLKDVVVAYLASQLENLKEAVSTFSKAAAKLTAEVVTRAAVPAGVECTVLVLPTYAVFFPAVVDASKVLLTNLLAKTLPHFIAQHMAAHLVLQFATFQNWATLIYGCLITGHLIIMLVQTLINYYYQYTNGN